MVRNGQVTLTDVKRVFRRLWWALPVSTLGLAIAAVGLAKLLPKKYTSETRVLVAKPIVSSKVVDPIVTEDLNHRLASMQEQILSRSRLEHVIEKFELYASDRNKVHMEDLVQRLKAAITITPMEPVRGTEDRSLPGFVVSVRFSDPTMAQRICTEITSMFMTQNGEARINQAIMATSFFTTEADNAKKELDAEAAKLAEFKKKYVGALPEQEQANLSLLGGMMTQLEATTQALSRAQQDKAFNETLLSQAEANWKSETKGGANPESLDLQLQTLQQQLTSLQAKYTDDHPDVIKTRSEIEEVKAKIEKNKAPGNDASADHASSSIAPPNVQQFRAKLKQDEINIADLSKRQTVIQQEIHTVEGRLQMSPAVEQQLKDLTSAYQAALDFYHDLQRKRDNSEVGKDLESKQQSEQFRVLDEPNLPLSPSFPKVPIFAAGGAGAGLIVALGILYLVAMSDRTIHNESDIEYSLKVPVLAMIPLVEPYGKQHTSKTLRSASPHA